MKKSEELNLSEQTKLFVSFAKNHSTLESFYKNIDSLELSSIQDLSFENDIEYFHELSFILSVIFSIIQKPHLNNKREEIIVRSGEASSLSEEGYQKTLQDTSIWKDKGTGEIIPEYLYYHVYEDEIRIYENIFVVHVINELSFALDHYNSLYVSLLKVLDGKDELIKNDSAIESAMKSLNKLIRRMNQIKNTYFYHVVNRAKNKPKVFYPTNILVRDRLYNIVFKFYKKMYVFDSKEDIDEGLYYFYFAMILSVLKERGFKTTGRKKLFDGESFILPPQLIFSSEQYNLVIELKKEENAFLFNYHDDDFISKHLLTVSSDSTFQDLKAGQRSEDILTVEYLSLWHLGQSNGKSINLINETLLSERQLIDAFIESHHHVVEGSERLYSTYCPSCKSRNIVLNNGYYECPDCGVIYRFEKKSGNHMVFLKVKGN